MVLDRAIRVGVRQTVNAAKPSENFRARMAGSVIAQRWAPTEKSWQPQSVPGWGGWVIAAAAGAAAIFGIQSPSTPGESDNIHHKEPVQKAGLDSMIDQFVDWHARPLPPEVTNPNDLPGFEPYVGVPVHPPSFSPFGARLLGGRILPVRDERVAAMLQYTLGSGHRISVYVYDPRRLETISSRLQARVVGTEPIYVGQVRGWSVAAAEHRGVGYAVASDLDDAESAELALAAWP